MKAIDAAEQSEAPSCSTDADEERPLHGNSHGQHSPASQFFVLGPVVLVLFLDYLVIALPRSLLPEMMEKQYGSRLYIYHGVAESIRGVLTFLSAPALGSISDIVGRKWILILCITATAAPVAILAFTQNLDVFLVGLVVSGALASTFPIAFAHLSDFIPSASRADAFGVALGVGLGGAFMIGPALGAIVAKLYGRQAVFDLCLWLTVANALLAAGTIQRKRPARLEKAVRSSRAIGQRSDVCRRANPLVGLQLIRDNKAIRLLSAITFCYYIALWGFISNSLLYARRRFGLDSSSAAALLTTFGVTNLACQSVGLTLAKRLLSEAQITRWCFVCSTVAMMLFGVATRPWPLYVSMVLIGVSVGGFACISSLATQAVDDHRTGEAQGVITSLKAITEGIGPLVTSLLLPAFEKTWLPGAPWLLCALCVLLALSFCAYIEAVIAPVRRAHHEASPLANS